MNLKNAIIVKTYKQSLTPQKIHSHCGTRRVKIYRNRWEEGSISKLAEGEQCINHKPQRSRWVNCKLIKTVIYYVKQNIPHIKHSHYVAFDHAKIYCNYEESKLTLWTPCFLKNFSATILDKLINEHLPCNVSFIAVLCHYCLTG